MRSKSDSEKDFVSEAKRMLHSILLRNAGGDTKDASEGPKQAPSAPTEPYEATENSDFHLPETSFPRIRMVNSNSAWTYTTNK